MKYYGLEKDPTNNSTRIGVLLVNLGTPEQPSYAALRKYLSEFLMDPRVIELPSLLRILLVKGVIVNFRSHQSAANYRKIWTDAGSPLLINCERLTDRSGALLGDDFDVELAMRYGKPSIRNKLGVLHERGVRELVVVPLYPQYSGSTIGSTFDGLAKSLSKFRWVPRLHLVNSYHLQPSYISALAESIRQHWHSNERAQKLLMSFHGVPQKYISNGDPYQLQCSETAFRVAQELGLSDNQWMLVYQSRFGTEKWLQPYCEQTLKSLPAQGIKSVDIICPGFSVDCLETLQEIDTENREYFIQAGGESYSYIACLNDSQGHAELIAELVRETVSLVLHNPVSKPESKTPKNFDYDALQ